MKYSGGLGGFLNLRQDDSHKREIINKFNTEYFEQNLQSPVDKMNFGQG